MPAACRVRESYSARAAARTIRKHRCVLEALGPEIRAPFEAATTVSTGGDLSARRRSHRSPEGEGTQIRARTRSLDVTISLCSGVDVGDGVGDVDSVDLRRIEQASRVIAQTENDRTLRRGIRATPSKTSIR